MVFRIKRSTDKSSNQSKDTNTFYVNMDHISVISDYTKYSDSIRFEIVMNNGKNYIIVTYFELFDQFTRKHIKIDKELTNAKFMQSYSKLINDWVKCLEFEKEREISWLNYDFTYVLKEEKTKEAESNIDDLDIDKLKAGIDLVKKHTNHDIHIK